MSIPYLYDAGALIAIDNNDRRMWARHSLALDDGPGQQQHSYRRVPHHIVSASEAAPKLTLNRRHQMDTARYLLKSIPAGTS